MPLTTQAQAFIDLLAANANPPWDSMTPPEAREAFGALIGFAGEGPPLKRVENHTLPKGTPIRVYSDADAGSVQPAVMYFHGGGWVLGNVDSHDAVCRRLAKAAPVTVISVDYALAPEHPFPRPLDDCFDATRHVVDDATQLAVDPNRIAVAGDSAGGNLAAAVSLKARDEGGPAISLQVLIYPVVERNYDTESYRSFGEGHGLSLADMKWFWDCYVGTGSPPPYAAVSSAASHQGLPPAHVVTAEYDVLRDEGESYAAVLRAAGVPTSSKRYDGNLHGFIQLAGMFDDGVAATEDIARVIADHLC